MSVSATNLASSVAAAPASSQQTARARERGGSSTSTELRQLRDRIEVHVQALDEGDDAESPAQLRVDAQVPEHQNPNQDQPRRQRRRAPDAGAAQNPSAEVTPEANPESTEAAVKAYGPAVAGKGSKAYRGKNAGPASSQALYKHLDVQA